MNLAHIVNITPHRAGIYETARDLAAAERKLGHEARLVSPGDNPAKIKADRGVPVAGAAWAKQADAIINHSGLTVELLQAGRPIVHMLHGRPYSSFLLEQAGKIPVYSFIQRIGRDERYSKFVTFWREFLPYFANILPVDRLDVIPPPVDLEQWTTNGPGGYTFGGHRGRVNIVVADVWRDDKDPFHVINAFMAFARGYEGQAKLHIYAAPKGSAFNALLAAVRERGWLGEVKGFVRGLDNVYRAADCLITPHRIATRSVREALACGCEVVMAPGEAKYTPYMAEPEDISAYAAEIGRAINDLPGRNGLRREIAKMQFDSLKSANALLEIINRIRSLRSLPAADANRMER